MIYSLQEIKKIPKISGIYKIINIINNKFYIGSSLDIKIRCVRHKYTLLKNKHKNIHLQRAVNKHGINNFNLEIIATCPKEYNIKMEQWFLDVLKPVYNIKLVADSPLGIKLTSEHKRKLSLSKQGIKNSQAKLNLTQVEEIRKSKLKGCTLSKIYGVSTSQISMVKNYKSYI